MKARFVAALAVAAIALAACGGGKGLVGGDNEADDSASYVGLTLEDASARAEANDRTYRVVREDGVDLPVTMDYQPERLNFSVENGVVVDAKTDAEAAGGSSIEPGEQNNESDAYVGLTVEDAGALAAERGLVWRVVREDGEDLMITMDYREDRLNFTVEDGIVVDARTDAEMAGN